MAKYRLMVERHVENCPACNGLVTEDDIKACRPVYVEALGWLLLRQTATLVCPHCGHTETKTFEKKIRDLLPTRRGRRDATDRPRRRREPAQPRRKHGC